MILGIRQRFKGRKYRGLAKDREADDVARSVEPRTLASRRRR